MAHGGRFKLLRDSLFKRQFFNLNVALIQFEIQRNPVACPLPQRYDHGGDRITDQAGKRTRF